MGLNEDRTCFCLSPYEWGRMGELPYQIGGLSIGQGGVLVIDEVVILIGKRGALQDRGRQFMGSG